MRLVDNRCLKDKFFKITCIVIVLFFSVSFPAAEQKMQENDFSVLFNNLEGTIVVYDNSSDKYIIHNKPRSTTRYTPFSTFKIPHSIIALETNVIKNINAEFIWDSTKYPSQNWWPAQWNNKHNMQTAIKFSVVPFYQEVASRIGRSRMSKYIRLFGYGNADISSGDDNFWLNGSLSISAMEQIEFLRKFYNNDFGVQKKSIEAVKEIMVQETGSDYTLYGKSGAGTGFKKDTPKKALGWYVGYVEQGQNVYFFALNVEAEDFGKIVSARIEITQSVLKKIGIIQ